MTTRLTTWLPVVIALLLQLIVLLCVLALRDRPGSTVVICVRQTSGPTTCASTPLHEAHR